MAIISRGDVIKSRPLQFSSIPLFGISIAPGLISGLISSQSSID
ncbi:MAG: hypothetical protein P8H42_04195 [Saprospiraceae bacterium]|nr:hypothetical protein [Saprospiraceae bacterium]